MPLPGPQQASHSSSPYPSPRPRHGGLQSTVEENGVQLRRGWSWERACSCQGVCVHLEGTGEREEHKSLVEGPSFGTRVVSRIRVGPTVMLFHTDPTPFQPTACFAWGIGKRFRVAVRPLGEGVGVASTQRGSRWSSLAEGPSVEEAPVLRFDKGFSLLTTVVRTYICDCLYFKLPPGREGERGKGISHECPSEPRKFHFLPSLNTKDQKMVRC
ncbi:hypothetical protein D623_10003478 [Myotis brandtii]|uniref:Uncharacterized protein n=1 Tax=Myotis brandtii TaxID=109478 RepID=S7PPJ6_MYOBR|nr:hypothetical protein D623_10003478 [Myotis brandtii]